MNYAHFVCKFVPRSCVSNLLRYTSSVAIFIVSAFSTNIVRQSLCLLQIWKCCVSPYLDCDWLRMISRVYGHYRTRHWWKTSTYVTNWIIISNCISRLDYNCSYVKYACLWLIMNAVSANNTHTQDQTKLREKHTDTLELNKHNFQHVTAIRSLSLSIIRMLRL